MKLNIFAGRRARKAEQAKREEEHYQIVLEDWKESVNNTDMRKPPRPKYIGCIPLALEYRGNPGKTLEMKAQHIREHPRELHWHIPRKIRESDFMDFVDNATIRQLKQLKYRYEADPR